MLFYLDGNRRIIDNNPVISYVSALKVIAENPLAEWHETDFSFTMGEDRPGFEKAFYLEPDGTIRMEYAEIPPEPAAPAPLSEQEQLAIDTALNVEYIACLMEANLQQL